MGFLFIVVRKCFLNRPKMILGFQWFFYFIQNRKYWHSYTLFFYSLNFSCVYDTYFVMNSFHTPAKGGVGGSGLWLISLVGGGGKYSLENLFLKTPTSTTKTTTFLYFAFVLWIFVIKFYESYVDHLLVVFLSFIIFSFLLFFFLFFSFLFLCYFSFLFFFSLLVFSAIFLFFF